MNIGIVIFEDAFGKKKEDMTEDEKAAARQATSIRRLHKAGLLPTGTKLNYYHRRTDINVEAEVRADGLLHLIHPQPDFPLRDDAPSVIMEKGLGIQTDGWSRFHVETENGPVHLQTIRYQYYQQILAQQPPDPDRHNKVMVPSRLTNDDISQETDISILLRKIILELRDIKAHLTGR